MAEIDSQSDSLYKHTIRVATDKPFNLFKADATKELEGSWYSFSVRYEWLGKKCIVKTRIGMRSTLEYDNGVIVANVYSRPIVPSSLKRLIHRDIERSTARVAIFSDVEKKKKEGRAEMIERAAKIRDDVAAEESYASWVVHRLQAVDEVNKLLVLMTSGSAFALILGGSGWSTLVSGAAGVLASISATLKVPQSLEDWVVIKSRLTQLRSDLRNLSDHLAVAVDFSVNESKDEMSRLTSTFGEIRASKRQHFILTMGIRANEDK